MRATIAASSSLAVVLPAEPDNAATTARVRLRQKRASSPMAVSTSSTTSTAVFSASSGNSREASTAAAPCSTAAAAKSCPSARLPGRQQKSDPAATARLSAVTALTCVSR